MTQETLPVGQLVYVRSQGDFGHVVGHVEHTDRFGEIMRYIIKMIDGFRLQCEPECLGAIHFREQGGRS